jgi:exo-beta-1,3-glucanase (GH17 family)
VTVYPITAAPTPVVTVYKTPGTYALPTVTVHLNKTITVIAKKTATLTSGTNYFGGYTTTVNGSSTITYPCVATETNGSKVTEVVTYSTTVCPSAGVYTPVAPTVTVVSTKTVVVYAVPTQYAPGDYTVPAATYTATAYDEVYVCEYESVKATKVATVTEKYTTSAVASVYYTSSAPAAPVVPSWAPPAVVYSSVPAVPSAPAVPVKANGKKWAMTYTPYNDAGQCKTAAEVDADITIIAGKGFTTVRLYATDCSGLVNIGAACKAHGLKVILGVFIKAAGIDDARPQLADIAKWGSGGNWGLVTMIVIGNEALFNGYCSASALAGFISEAKSTFAAAGYYGPITTTEPLDKLQEAGSVLCNVIDVVGANIQPYFNSGVRSSEAGTFVLGQLALVAAVCPGKTAYNLESGWPSSGNNNGAAYATPADQAAAIADIVDKAGEHSVIFSFGNDPWKADGSFGVEKHFGCSQLF